MTEPTSGSAHSFAERSALSHRRVLCGLTLAMMALSWPIWHTSQPIPRFPTAWLEGIAPNALRLDPYAVALCLLGLVGCLTHEYGRLGAFLVALSGFFLILMDQQRLQAWFYQTIILCAVYALLPGAVAIGFARFFAVALYFHSAISKMDWSFAHSMGPYLMSPIFDTVPLTLSPTTRQSIVMALPVGELLFALALAVGWWRIGLAGATIMHSMLFVLLGPWLLDHSGNVLLWNVSMLAQARLLFKPLKWNEATSEKSTEFETEAHPRPQPPALGLVQLLMLVVGVMPFFERAGLWDPWPSFALYAGHVEQVRIDWPTELKADIPSEYQPFLTPAGDNLTLDLTLWSRARFGVPLYPAQRIQRRLASHIAESCPDKMPIRAIFLSKAHWRSGMRRETILLGRDAIRSSP